LGGMRYLVRMNPHGVLRDALLSSIRAVARSVGVDVRNPKWTSYGALEVDVFAQSKADLDTFLAAAEPLVVLEFVRDLNVAPPYMTDDELFAEARKCFNSERYWECHEILEGAWRHMSGAEKRYVQGVILVCAAFVHHQKDEDKVALGVLRRALRQLDIESPTYHGIDVGALKRQVERIAFSGRFEAFRI
jgi:hypothetical protein